MLMLMPLRCARRRCHAMLATLLMLRSVYSEPVKDMPYGAFWRLHMRAREDERYDICAL